MKYLGNSIRPIALDMASTLFFAAVFVITRSLIAATLIGIAVGIGQVAWLRLRRRNIGALQWASVGLVVVMGAAAILTHDPRLVMIKPTIIYTVVAASMLQPGWITVGTEVDVRHLAATPAGAKVRTTARVIEVERRVIRFEVEAFDEIRRIGEGRHGRGLVNFAAFTERFGVP